MRVFRETERCEKCDSPIRYGFSGRGGSVEVRRYCKCKEIDQSVENSFFVNDCIRDLFESASIYEDQHNSGFPKNLEHLKYPKEELLDCIQNLMGLIDTPIARKKICGEFADEARGIGRDVMAKYKYYFDHQ